MVQAAKPQTDRTEALQPCLQWCQTRFNIDGCLQTIGDSGLHFQESNLKMDFVTLFQEPESSAIPTWWSTHAASSVANVRRNSPDAVN